MCVSKNIKIKLYIPAGGAAVAPPLGPVLGQYGVNTVQFCKEFNEATYNLSLFFGDNSGEGSRDFVLVVNIFVNEDRTCTFEVCKPSVSFLLRVLTGVQVGAPRKVAGVLSLRELVYLARFKFPFLSLESSCRAVRGSARSIGVKIVY